MACFFLRHALSTVGTCVNRYVPNHVQSIEFTTGGLQSSCIKISVMINGNRMHLSSISSLIAKGLNTYVNMVFLFFIFNTFALSLWGIVCKLMRVKKCLLHFRIML